MTGRTRKSDASHSMAELLRGVLGEVTPLRAPARVTPARDAPVPLPRQRLRDEQAVLRESLEPAEWEPGVETGEELSFAREGIDARTLGRLRRGHWIIQDELDLHGFTVADAHDVLAAFIAQCTRRGLRCVRIIHGKGLRSPNRQPVLKQKVAAWLARRDEILAYCQARPTDGGSGAALVLLKGQRQKQEGRRLS